MVGQDEDPRHHHHHEVLLPLRLAAEPYAKERISVACVALSVHPELAILVDDDGIQALACERLLTRSELVALVASMKNSGNLASDSLQHQSLLLLVRTSATSNDLEWYHLVAASTGGGGDSSSTIANDTEHPQRLSVHSSLSNNLVPHSCVLPHTQDCAQWITTSIRTYYAQQILEPSVRGFLSVLEKQFSQSNLYIFELLQNAVDDGATTVTFVIPTTQNNNGSSSSSTTGLIMSHNGRRFTPLDVLGLSSVGLSTKSSQGKRTIGFMGVGFKAVYKRYARVTIDDGTYAFRYQEPSASSAQNAKKTGPATGGYGWVMLPMWQTPQYRDGCQFMLELPRGGLDAVRRDLAVLPKTAPPLLGRAALLKQQQGQNEADSPIWTLDWNGKVHKVQRTQLETYSKQDVSEIVTIDITHRDGSRQLQRWLFVAHEYTPSREALESYHQHTKRTHSGTEQVCGFVPLQPDGTLATNFSGVVHSVLPTKIKLPIPLHLQGSFLLSVDRQQVQDLSDNAWNLNILKMLPNVVATIFRWAARQKLQDYSSIVKLLPIPSSPTTTDILGQSISLQALERAMYSEPILPVYMPLKMKEVPQVNDEYDYDGMDIETDAIIPKRATIEYYEGSKAIWVPPSFLRFLDPDFLRGWLGRRPLRTDSLGKGESGPFHPVWSCSQVIQSMDPLPNRTMELSLELQLKQPKRFVAGTTPAPEGCISKLLHMMAAIGAAYLEQPTESDSMATATTDKNITASTREAVRGPRIPTSCKDWPVFLNETSTLATIDQIMLPEAAFGQVPLDLVELLRPFMRPDGTKKTRENKMNGNDGKKFRNNRKPNQKPLNIPKKLHPELEDAMSKLESGIDTVGACQVSAEVRAGVLAFLERVRAEFPLNITIVESAISNMLESCSKAVTCTEAQMAAVLKVARYAVDTSNAELLSFVAVDTPTGFRILPAAKAYIGKTLDTAGPGADLEGFAGNKLCYISSCYASLFDQAVSRRSFLQLAKKAGVRTGLAVTITAVFDIKKETKTWQMEQIQLLPDKKAPALRNNNPKSDIRLPYGLEHTMSRKNVSVLDTKLAFEWEQLVASMTPESSIGFISLLLAIPTEMSLVPSPKTVQAAAACFNGKCGVLTDVEKARIKPITGNRGEARIPTGVEAPLRRRLYFLPPGQAGGKALDMCEAELVKQLKAFKWVPCKVRSEGESQDSSNVTLKCPEEVILEPDNTHPEMPVAQLPPALLARLKTSNLGKSLEWGTRAPPPPVAELLELSKSADVLFASKPLDRPRISVLASSMISVWTAIARAHLRDGLSGDDRTRLGRLCQSSKCSACIPVQRVLDAGGTRLWIVPTFRCVLTPIGMQRLGTSSALSTLKESTVASLVQADFVCDFGHSLHNPFFSDPKVSAVVNDLAGIPKLELLKEAHIIRSCEAFVHYSCTEEPVIANRLSPLRHAFSYSMSWILRSNSEVLRSGRLKVWVRSGPGIGAKALPRRWLSLKEHDARPVLDDSRVRSALLSPEMGIQRLGVLDHDKNEKDIQDLSTLVKLDEEIVQALGILRLSDKQFTVKTRAKGCATRVDDASLRLQLVFALLRSIEHDISYSVERIQGLEERVENSFMNSFLDQSYEAPAMIRHESLLREFKGPGMDKPSLTPMYAVLGQSKMVKGRCILVSGEPEDYCMELEELVLHHVGIRQNSLLLQSKPFRAALRLLSHIENETSFEKFVSRDFADFATATSWKRLTTRKTALNKVIVAVEKRNLQSLREALMLAEEACEDDADGGDKVLAPPRALLVELEQEAEDEAKKLEARKNILEELANAEASQDVEAFRATLEEARKMYDVDGAGIIDRALFRLQTLEHLTLSKDPSEKVTSMQAAGNDSDAPLEEGAGRGRGIVNLPAWMTTGTADPPLGNGRGVSNLPAWMSTTAVKPESRLGTEGMEDGAVDTSKNTLLHIPDTTLQEECGKPSASDTPARVMTGIGRGVSNLPAWMSTANPTGPAPGADPSTLSESAVIEAKSILSGILNSSDPGNLTGGGGGDEQSTKPIGDSEAGLAGAASIPRGVSNLPAWMTNPELSSKRSRSILEEEDDNEADLKRSRINEDSTTSYYILKLQISADKESKLMEALETTLVETAHSHGGSASIRRKESS